jgi:hypothetical protein
MDPVGAVGGMGAAKPTPNAGPKKTKNITETKKAVSVEIATDDLERPYALITVAAKRALLPTSDLLFGARELAARLGAKGVLVPDKETIAEIKEAFALAAGSPPTLRISLLVGFCGDGLYLHGASPIGDIPKDRLIDPSSLMLGDRPRKFRAVGDLTRWRKFVRRFAAGQPLVTFLLAAAFASMILRRLKVQPFAIVLYSKSSIGKSHLAVLVGSIFGGDPGRPTLGFAESFKATEAGIEKLAFAHNDALLILDEFSRVRGTPRDKLNVLEGFVNDLCAGVPMTRAVDALAGLQWSTAALITSNKSYADLVAEAGQSPAEAMGPRLIDLPADLGKGNGIFKSPPAGFENSQDAVTAMQANAMEVYGLAAPEFARALIEADKADGGDISSKLAIWKNQFSNWAGPDLPLVLGHLRDKFAAIYASGRLARHLGVLPKALNIGQAVRWAWRVSVIQGRQDRPDPVQTVIAYLDQNRARFSLTPLAATISEAKAARMVGLRHKTTEGDREYLIPKAAFRRAVGP